MQIINFEKIKINTDELEESMIATPKPIGKGAHVMVPKKYLGKEVIILVPKQKIIRNFIVDIE